MSNYIFVNNPYILTQNTNIYGQYINQSSYYNYDYTISINVAALAAISSSGSNNSTLNNGLIAWYQFNNSTNIGLDSSGNGYNLINNGNVTHDTTKTIIGSGCAYFNGSSYLQSPSFSLSSITGMTISMWIYNTNYNNNGFYFIMGQKEDPNLLLGVWDSNVIFNYKTGPNLPYAISSYNDTNIWINITCTINSTSRTIYRNGVYVTSDVITSNFTINLSPYFIFGTGISKNFNGYMDDARIYNRILSQSEITSLYNLKSNILSSLLVWFQFNNDSNFLIDNISGITLTRGTNNSSYGIQTTQFIRGNGSIQFNFGSYNYGPTAQDGGKFPLIINKTLNQFSISFWVYLRSNVPSLVSGSISTTLFNISDDNYTEHMFTLDNAGGNGKWRLILNYSGSVAIYTLNTNLFTLNTINNWYHLVFTLEKIGNNKISWKFYVNSVLANNDNTTFNWWSVNLTRFYLGSYAGGRGCDCFFDDFRVYNIVLTQTDITSIYNNTDGVYNNNDAILSPSQNGITGIFSNASYRQNENNPDLFDVNITLADHFNYSNWNNVYNNKPLYKIASNNSTIAFGTFKNTSEKFGYRLLEIIAHKLFGHAQAHAAISNDTQFYLHDGEIWDHLSIALLNNNFRNDIFCQYVALGRYNSLVTDINNNNNGWFNFNFINLTFDYPLFISGNILLDSSLTNAEKNLLQNGPNVGGGTLVNGVYNIPVLIKFHG